MTEEQLQAELASLHDKHLDAVTNVEGGRDAWVTLQYDKAFGMMNGSWNPSIAQNFLLNLQAELEHDSDGLT
jgi:hypothetical protein